MWRRLVIALALAVGVAWGGGPSRPGRRPQKRTDGLPLLIWRRAKKLETQNRWLEALAEYTKAADLHDIAKHRIKVAEAERRLGHLKEAAAALRLASADPKASKKLKKDLEQQIGELEARLGFLALKLPKGFKGKILIDKQEVGSDVPTSKIPVNPGTREVMVTSKGYHPWSQTIVFEEKFKKDVSVTLKPKPKAPAGGGTGGEVEVDSATFKTPPLMRMLGYTALGIGGAGLVLGSSFAIASKETRNQLELDCKNDQCTEHDSTLNARGKRQANMATLGFAVGGVGIVAGVVLLLLAPDEEASALSDGGDGDDEEDDDDDDDEGQTPPLHWLGADRASRNLLAERGAQREASGYWIDAALRGIAFRLRGIRRRRRNGDFGWQRRHRGHGRLRW